MLLRARPTLLFNRATTSFAWLPGVLISLLSSVFSLLSLIFSPLLSFLSFLFALIIIHFLILSLRQGDLPRFQRLIRDGANVNAFDDEQGRTPLYLASNHCFENDDTATVLWLVEHGGANITLADGSGTPILDFSGANHWESLLRDEAEDEWAPMNVLLRAMLLKAAPPGSICRLRPAKSRMVKEGARLRVRLPAYLVQRRALVTGYQEPTTTEELWATGLGQAP
jgi:hypothetical protein